MALELDISRIRNVPGSHERFHLETNAFDFMDDAWTLNGPMVIDVEIHHQGQFLELSGQIQTELKSRCVRCLQPVTLIVHSKLQEQLLYAKDVSLFSHLAVGEVEEKYFIYDHDTLDITDIIREAVLADLPPKVLCREDCRGLCPRCGKNFNDGHCDCQIEEIDPRLAILAKLKENGEV